MTDLSMPSVMLSIGLERIEEVATYTDCFCRQIIALRFVEQSIITSDSSGFTVLFTTAYTIN